jgi:hypothetical protein
MALTVTKTVRGNPCVIFESNHYRKDKTLKGGIISWRCIKGGCSASIKTDARRTEVLEASGRHLHPLASTEPSPSPRTTKNNCGVNEISPDRVACVSPSLTELLTPYNVHITPISHTFVDTEEENSHLRQLVSELRYEKEALTNKCIELECKLMKKDSIVPVVKPMVPEQIDTNFQERVDISCQTVAIEQQSPNSLSYVDNPKIFVHRHSQTHLPDSHQCFELVERIKELQITCAGYKMRISEGDKELDELKEKLKVSYNNLKLLKIQTYDYNSTMNAALVTGSNCDRTPDSSLPCHVQSDISWKKVKRKLLIVGDSHARGLLERMTGTLSPNVDTIAYVYPGAPMSYILGSMLVRGAVASLSKNDYLFVVGGTNGFTRGSGVSDVSSHVQAVNKIVEDSRHTNIIFSTIPYRYDLANDSWENRLIKETNESLRRICGACLIELWNVRRGFHTTHGLHFNGNGKTWIINEIKSALLAAFKRGTSLEQSRSDGDISDSEVRNRTLAMLDPQTIDSKSVTEICYSSDELKSGCVLDSELEVDYTLNSADSFSVIDETGYSDDSSTFLEMTNPLNSPIR